MSKLDITNNLNNILSDYNPSYSQGFVARVMQNINSEDLTHVTKDNEFYNIFKWIAISGVAAIIVLLFAIYFTEGSLSPDAFYGLLHYTPDETIIASLNY